MWSDINRPKWKKHLKLVENDFMNFANFTLIAHHWFGFTRCPYKIVAIYKSEVVISCIALYYTCCTWHILLSLLYKLLNSNTHKSNDLAGTRLVHNFCDFVCTKYEIVCHIFGNNTQSGILSKWWKLASACRNFGRG